MRSHTLAASLLAAASLTGCTVHNHYYGSAPGTTPGTTPAPGIATLGGPGVYASAYEPSPGYQTLAAQLEGVTAAIEVVTTNIANTESLSYKAKRVTFIEGQPQPQITIDWSMGSPMVTDRELDLYIEGDGFFQVELPNGQDGNQAYTRLGDFCVNRDGELVIGNSEGNRMADGITVSDEAIGVHVASDGTVSELLPDGTTSEIGQIELHRFNCPDGLGSLGNGLYIETEASGPAAAGYPGEGPLGTLGQGALESSNVKPSMEMAELAQLTRWANVMADELGLSDIQHQMLYMFPAQTIPTDEPGIMLVNDF